MKDNVMKDSVVKDNTKKDSVVKCSVRNVMLEIGRAHVWTPVTT